MSREFEHKVFPAEWKEIDESRKHRLKASPHQPVDSGNPFPDADRLKLAGLALSGGGIRSATFNLGVIQALAKLGLLKHFDYLSTVSGGGYIGSWLSAWICREKHRGGVIEVEKILADSAKHEPDAVKFLRDYSNYLTPENSLLSADTWTSVATYVRNSFLNLLLLLFVFAAVLLVPRWLAAGAFELARLMQWNHAVELLGWAPLVVAMVLIGRNLAAVNAGIEQGEKYPGFAEPGYIQRWIIGPVLLSSLFATLWFGLRGIGRDWLWYEWALVVAGIYFVLCLFGTGIGGLIARSKRWRGRLRQETRADGQMWKNLLWAIPAGAVGGLILYGIARWIGTWRLLSGEPNYLLIVSWGPPLMLLLAATVVTLHIGFTGRLLKSEVQEWWLRLSAWLMIYTLGWIALFVAALYAPILFYKLGQLGSALQTGGFFAWLATTVMGVLAGRSPRTGAEGSRAWLDRIAPIAAYVFVIGFVGLVSVGLHRLLLRLFAANAGVTGDWLVYWDQIAKTSGVGTFGVFLVCAAIALVLSLRIDINIFSLHYYYRNRLVRCYLGASRGTPSDPGGERQPNPFTGFDPRDNLALAQLATDMGPYQIVNTALNLVHGDNLAWQQRKATSFVFTPKFCGYEPWTAGTGYRETQQYAQADYTPADRPVGPSLGTALAISGAAFSPNMGYHSSPSVAFLLTVFSVRLGVWFGNPRHEGPEFSFLPDGLREIFGLPDQTWKQQGPRLSLPYLLFELFGLTNERRAFVNLSDGGHFENLGVYELVRRRCKYILAIDAGQDGGFGFEDLGNAIRKCRIDLDTEIAIDVTELFPRQKRRTERVKKDDRHSNLQHAVGTITYPDKTTGILVYFKPALTGQESADIRNYASAHPDFPHQSTTDQWFDESQFESYRKLGCHIAEKSLTDDHGKPWADGASADAVEKLFGLVGDREKKERQHLKEERSKRN